MSQSKMGYKNVLNRAALRRDSPLDETPAPGAHLSEGFDRSREAVYFARCQSHVKIGYTKNLEQRAKEHLRTAAKYEQEHKIVAAVHGNKNSEAALHSYFAKYALGREEFSHAPELTDYIRWLRTLYFVQVPEEQPDKKTIKDVPVVDYDQWKPTPDRRISYVPNLLCSETEYEDRIITGDDYYTPDELIQLARSALDFIQLDPASHPAANQRIRAHRFYTKAENGLVRPWYGRVWLNPPFSQWSEFAEKLVREWQGGKIERMLALVSSMAVTARYMAPVLRCADLIVIPEGRYQFWGPLAGTATNGHVLVGFGKTIQDIDDMKRAFEGMSVWIKVNGDRK